MDLHHDAPLLAVTMGDPAGVGPEVVVRAWADPRVHAACRAVAVGRPEILQRAVSLVGGEAEVVTVDSLTALNQTGLLASSPRCIPCLPTGSEEALAAPPGKNDPRSGQAAYDAIVLATRRALAGQIAGIVTGPISKTALHQAGHHYPGHTELLAELCGVQDIAMMLYLPKPELPDSRAGLGVVHATLHCALRSVPGQLTPGAIAAKCKLAHAVFSRGFGVEAPRIGVCALNPHAGEEGLFGDEERRIIEPAVGMARAAGIAAAGPVPADALMVRARDGEFDAVVAMYHDQGHVALKLLGMHRAVNITLGLPIIRTSVAHGTAFDRAWLGTAESSGMVAAILAASELARRRFRFGLA
jgi:4-hydroxythreonine-4-phosphate dehydrogenase